ncbi:DNA helicase [Phialemonium atrogriseum]|uniref:DNA helicase n=1 Tax=Phialemonium atrogriseum TaxID=1093897 RepID=A0AAJ0C264_9PEZI|nr:DNA helicase [Phialemonium atrogriseum]KAK1766326.1 DNA helicase [Phialemonium atrogriseum]
MPQPGPKKGAGKQPSEPAIGGKKLGFPNEITNQIVVSLVTSLSPDTLTLKRGFGVCHTFDRRNQRMVPTDLYRITVKFPRGQFSRSSADMTVRNYLPSAVQASKNLTILIVDVHADAEVTVEGFGMPFTNPGHPSEGWINKDEAIIDKVTLLDILQQRHFAFVVGLTADSVDFAWDPMALGDPFSYPYGTEHSWDMARYKTMLLKTKGHQFAPASRFINDNEHVACLTQSVVQDTFWLEQDAETIRNRNFSAYFVTTGHGAVDQMSTFYTIVSLNPTFYSEFEISWRRLSKCDSLFLRLFKDKEDPSPVNWQAKLVDNPKDFDAGLHEAERKVKATCLLLPGAEPFNPVGCRDRQDAALTPVDLRADVEHMMRLQRDLMRGTGFWPSCRPHREAVIEITTALNAVNIDDGGEQVKEVRKTRPIPSVSLFDTKNAAYLESLLEEALVDDRARFKAYMSERPLGVGLITVPAGTNLTPLQLWQDDRHPAGVVGMMANPRIGKVFGSAPSHGAVDNFAARVAEVDARVTSRYNETMQQVDPTHVPLHRRLIVRGYRIEHEIAAFKHLLQFPDNPNNAAPHGRWKKSHWKLPFSPTFWLLVVLRHKGIETSLGPGDKPSLLSLREKIDNAEELAPLCDVATGKIDWAEYVSTKGVHDNKIRALLEDIVAEADGLFTVPAAVSQEDQPYFRWHRETAQGIAIDEAGNMGRPDAYASVLGFLKESGFPVYRLRTQLRMAKGQFDMIHRLIYSNLPLRYGPECDISRHHHANGVRLEAYLTERYPSLKPSPPDTLAPVFVNCKGTYTLVDPVTRSKKNPDQARLALDFISDFVEKSGVDPSKVVVSISPYKMNVECINTMVRKEYPILHTMQLAATVDSFQGREGQIAVVVMGTTQKSGPGFTTDNERLTVMMTRQRSSLLVFGDLDVTGKIEGKDAAKLEKEANKRIQVVDDEGQVHFAKAVLLRSIMAHYVKMGRVIKLEAPKKVTAAAASGPGQ